MNENNDLLPNLLHEEFEMQMRGYSRRQVDDFVARRNNEIRELEQRLARSLDETEHMRRDLSVVRQQALAGRPAHEEVSERIAQILKLADDEAKAQKGKAEDDITALRTEAKQESDRVRADAREQAERMLTAAQEQAERTISAARSEAEKTRNTARAEADQLTSETRKRADAALSQAKAQAKRVLDEATARATAIHDGAERRLNLLSTRHGETVRRLTDILDGVQGLVAAEAARMSLEEEVNQTATRTMSLADAADANASAGDAVPSDLAGDSVPAQFDSAQFDQAQFDSTQFDRGQHDADRDLATLAPPAPETVSTGSVAPPFGEEARAPMPTRQGMTGRLNPLAPDDEFGQRGIPMSAGPMFADNAPDGAGGLPPQEIVPRGPFGLPLPTPQSPLGDETAPFGGADQEEDSYRPAAPRPGSTPFIPGFSSEPLPEREPRRNGGFTDPENPTEGIRLL
jgi:cell division septum initiation protein DivIVA